LDVELANGFAVLSERKLGSSGAVTLIASYRRHALRQGFGQTVTYSDHLAPAFAAPRRYQYRIEERR